MPLAHLVPITAILSAGAYSVNIEIATGGGNLRLITLEPENEETTFTFKIVSPTGRTIKQLKAKGRVYDSVDIPFSGVYTVSVIGAVPASGTINGELSFEH